MLTIEQLQAAIEDAKGNISFAARKLGITRKAIYKRITVSPTLQDTLKDARESFVDNAESALQSAVLKGESWAVCFTLKTLGRSRGYVEKIDVNVISDIERELARLGFGTPEGIAQTIAGNPGSDFVN